MRVYLTARWHITQLALSVPTPMPLWDRKAIKIVYKNHTDMLIMTVWHVVVCLAFVPVRCMCTWQQACIYVLVSPHYHDTLKMSDSKYDLYQENCYRTGF